MDDVYASDELIDFMRLRSGQVSLASENAAEVSQAVAEVFAGIESEDFLREIGEIGDASPGTNASITSRSVASSDIIDDKARSIVSSVDTIDDSMPAKSATYKRFSQFIKDGSLSNLFEDKLIRRSTFAIAGLAAFGFIYSARKDRTEDDVMGPPLLPGGSAYETDYPFSGPSISDLKYLNPTVAGMQYKINVTGSQQDIEKMQYLANGVIDGPVDSTIYNSLPRVGRDPYSDVASRF
jgi:hypothetical protein